VAGGFTRYDAHAIKQIDRTIELIRYRRFGDEFLLLELVGSAAAIAEPATRTAGTAAATHRRARRGTRTISDRLAAAPADLRDRYEALASYLLALGDDVQARTLTTYVAFRRLTNFACVDIHPQLKRLVVYAKVDPDGIELVPGFTRDVRAVGHPGTGDLEVAIDGDEDLERAKPLLLRSYEAS
jgi:predicted transport protein